MTKLVHLVRNPTDAHTQALFGFQFRYVSLFWPKNLSSELLSQWASPKMLQRVVENVHWVTSSLLPVAIPSGVGGGGGVRVIG